MVLARLVIQVICISLSANWWCRPNNSWRIDFRWNDTEQPLWQNFFGDSQPIRFLFELVFWNLFSNLNFFQPWRNVDKVLWSSSRFPHLQTFVTIILCYQLSWVIFFYFGLFWVYILTTRWQYKLTAKWIFLFPSVVFIASFFSH